MDDDIWKELAEMDALDAPPLIPDPESVSNDEEAPESPSAETDSDEEESAPEELVDPDSPEPAPMETGDVDQPEEQVVDEQPAGEDQEPGDQPSEPVVTDDQSQETPDVVQSAAPEPVVSNEQSPEEPVSSDDQPESVPVAPEPVVSNEQSPEEPVSSDDQPESVPVAPEQIVADDSQEDPVEQSAPSIGSEMENSQPPESPVSDFDLASPEPEHDAPEATGLVAETELPAASVADFPSLDNEAVASHEDRIQKQIIDQQKANEGLAHQLADKLGPKIDEARHEQEKTVMDYMDTQILLTNLIGRVY